MQNPVSLLAASFPNKPFAFPNNRISEARICRQGWFRTCVNCEGEGGGGGRLFKAKLLKGKYERFGGGGGGFKPKKNFRGGSM